MNISTNVGRAVLGIGGVVALAALIAPQVASAAPGGKGGSTSPSPTPTPTASASSSAYFVSGSPTLLPDTGAQVIAATTPTLAAGNYIANAVADLYDYVGPTTNTYGNAAVACDLALSDGSQQSFPVGQRIHTSSDGSVALTWAFTGVKAGDTIVLRCTTQQGIPMQVSHSAITVVPVGPVVAP